MAYIDIYTDGSALGNPGPGGYAAVLLSGDRRLEISGGFSCTTNNRMELMAVVEALQALRGNDHTIRLYSDSKYVVDAFVKDWIGGWKRRAWKNVKNIDLWRRLLPLTHQHQITWCWIKGHAEIPENERCDRLAVAASLKPTAQDFGFQPEG